MGTLSCHEMSSILTLVLCCGLWTQLKPDRGDVRPIPYLPFSGQLSLSTLGHRVLFFLYHILSV